MAKTKCSVRVSWSGKIRGELVKPQRAEFATTPQQKSYLSDTIWIWKMSETVHQSIQNVESFSTTR